LLLQVLSEVQGLKSQVRDLRTVLMGDGETETPHGRLPQVEAKIEDHNSRLKALEEWHIKHGVWGAGAGKLGTWAAGIVAAAIVVILERIVSYFVGH
jgi:hypothetical protein